MDKKEYFVWAMDCVEARHFIPTSSAEEDAVDSGAYSYVSYTIDRAREIFKHDGESLFKVTVIVEKVET